MIDKVSIVPLAAPDIPSVLAIADECVGKNLYTKSDFERVLEDKDSFVSLLKSSSGFIVGYIYFFVTTTKDVASSCSQDESLFSSVSRKRCGRIQSVAVKSEYRGHGFSTVLMKSALDKLRMDGVETVFIVCWKPGAVVNLKKAITELGFSFLKEVERMWWNNTSLYCPYCNGRCSCSSEIYYKNIKENSLNET